MTPPFVMVIFGATGDLMHRKLMPALYQLCKQSLASSDLFIVGVGRREITTDGFREMMAAAVHEAAGSDFDLRLWGKLTSGMYYEQGYFEDPALYQRLVTLLARFDETMRACVPRFFYLATPPHNYEEILTHLGKSELAEGCGHGTINFTRVLIEKPFGKDLQTARNLDTLLASIFEEKQIYRIDHYLGKETVQNILAFRFANGIFEPTWNHEFIDHVQITLGEEVGVGTRGAFYDGVGALRDVVQNHMLQMLALTAMEQPRAFDASSIRDERSRVLKSLVPIKGKHVSTDVVRGQYIASDSRNQRIKGYQEEDGVARDSLTETFVAMNVSIDTPRWRSVPFYLRTGKRLGKKITEISIHYKKPAVCTGDVCLFPQKDVLRNVVAIRIQPDDGVHLRLMVKQPGLGMQLAHTQMTFHYNEAFPDFSQPEAYEKLLLDAIRGDQMLFARTDGVKASWQFITPILEAWSAGAGSGVTRKGKQCRLHTYTPGSWGPKEAEKLIERDGRHWFLYGD